MNHANPRLAPRILGIWLGLVLVPLFLTSVGGVTGYINITIREGNNLLTNPLRTGTGATENAIAEVINPLNTTLPDGTCVFTFNPTNQTYRDAVMLHTNLGWFSSSGVLNDPTIKLDQGEGFAVQVPLGSLGGGTTTLTLVGQVLVGVNLTNPIPAHYSLKGNKLPIAGPLQTVLYFPARPADLVWRGNVAAQVFQEFGFGDSESGWSPHEPAIVVAEGFFVFRDAAEATSANWWIRPALLPFSLSAGAQAPKAAATAPRELSLTRIRVIAGVVTLEFSNPDAVTFDVQHSTDGVAWTTVSGNQTGSSWSGILPQTAQGFYRTIPN